MGIRHKVEKELRYQPVEYVKEQYDEKNAVLNEFGEWVSAVTFYEDIFKDLDLVMPIVIIDENEQKHILKMSIWEAIEQAQGRNDILMGGATFFNEFVSKATAKNIHSFIVDMDNVYSGVLLRSLQHNWRLETGEAVPMPTYIVNSGTGLHLYFVLDEPLPCYKSQLEQIDQLYRKLAVMETTRRVYIRKSVQWFGQDFRMAGGCGKNGWENTVFKVGKKWSADELAKAVGLKDIYFLKEGERKPYVNKEKQPRKRKKQKRQGYYLNSRVYESSVERCREETQEGNRYMSMCALSVLAWKCNIPIETLENDLLGLLPVYNKNSIRKVKKREVYSAMKMYNPKAMETPRERSEEWLGWNFKGATRNGRKRSEHLQAEYWKNERGRPEVNTCRQNRELALQFMRDNGEIKGRPKGSDKRNIVKEWQKNHPDGKKIDCERETGLSRHTVLKWWNE